MVYYEIKKIFARTGGKIAALLLLLTLIGTCWFAVMGVSYVNESGDAEKGVAAAHKLRDRKKEWAGPITEEKLAKALEENARINASPEAKDEEDPVKQDIVFGRKQGFYDLRRLMVYAFGDFNSYDYYIPDHLKPEEAAQFYPNRILNLKNWLDTDAEDLFTQKEKSFLIEQYEALETPLLYDYMEGWLQLFLYAPTLLMITVLLLGFLCANLFSVEFQTKADAVFFSSRYGRSKASAAKLKAGFLLVTAVYWTMVGAYTAVVLGLLGADGANCPIQASTEGWKSFYQMTNLQEYVLIVLGGYIGTLFMLFAVMFVSAKTRSAAVAVTVPFVLVFLPSFFGGGGSSFWAKLIGLLPDQLLQMNLTVRLFTLYDIGGRLFGAAQLLPVIYLLLTAVLVPVLYRVYRKSQVR